MKLGWRRKAESNWQALSARIRKRSRFVDVLLTGVLVHTSEAEVVQVEVLHSHPVQTPPGGTQSSLYLFFAYISF